MSEINPLLSLLLEGNSFVGQSETFENEIEPLPEQFALGIGDAAIATAADTPLERDFIVVRVVDPAKHAETYPDWEERVQLNAHLLCEVFSRMDPELRLGWYSRLKLMPITNYRYRQCRKWLKEGFPNESPEWAVALTRDFTNKLADQAPDTVPRTVRCPNCGSQDINLVVSRRVVYTAPVGQIRRDGKEVFLPVTDTDDDSAHTAQLVCTNCHSYATLDDDEWYLPGLSN